MGGIYDSFYRFGQVRVPTGDAVRGSAVGAGMNMLLAAGLRIVASDARLITGFQFERAAQMWSIRRSAGIARR